MITIMASSELRLTCDDLDQGHQAPSTFLLDYRQPQEGLEIQHDFFPFNFHLHDRQRYHHWSFFGRLVLPETKQTNCPLCIFEPALVNNKCLAGSQSSNMAAKSKLARPNLPPGAKIRCKSVAPSPHFCTKTIGGSARPEYFGWKQLRTARAHNYQFWSKSWRRWMLASKYIVLLFFLQGSIKKDIETSSSHFNRE